MAVSDGERGGGGKMSLAEIGGKVLPPSAGVSVLIQFLWVKYK
jgi:hypothetical protein